MTLYELTGEYLDLLELAENPDTDAKAIEQAMLSISGMIDDKAEGYCKVIQNLESTVSAIDLEAKRLNERKKAMKKHIEDIKNSLLASMLACGKTKIQGNIFDISIRNNAEKMIIDDESEIPSQFYVPQAPTLDTAALKKYLKENPEEEFDFAHLEKGRSLKIE